VYILTNKPNGTFYVGVTSDLLKRTWQHKSDFVESFAKKHQLHRLVWYEAHPTMESAIAREKLLKKWHRPWKKRLIEAMNPTWRDLFEDLGY
jgi:putative endonuclease